MKKIFLLLSLITCLPCTGIEADAANSEKKDTTPTLAYIGAGIGAAATFVGLTYLTYYLTKDNVEYAFEDNLMRVRIDMNNPRGFLRSPDNKLSEEFYRRDEFCARWGIIMHLIITAKEGKSSWVLVPPLIFGIATALTTIKVYEALKSKLTSLLAPNQTSDICDSAGISIRN